MPTLDLHGRTTDEIYDAMEAFLNKEVAKSTSQVRVMPGKGGGKVKAVVQDYLKRAGYPWQYEKTAAGTTNEGVLVVFLD